MKLPRHRLASLGTLALAGTLVLTGCGGASNPTASTATSAIDGSSTTALDASYIAITDLTELAYDDLSLPDFDVETSGSRTVKLADGATSAPDGVTVDGDAVTITAGGVYLLSGTLSAGQVVIDAGDEDVTVILDGVDITSPSVGALLVTSADDVQVFLEAGSTNSLADASGATVSEDTDGPNATLYSTADVWIGGTGSLAVNGVEDGITSKDSLVIDGGTYAVTAGDDGVRGKDHLVVLAGDLTVTAGGDGLASDNEEGGTDASAAVGVVWIADGSVDVTAGADGIQGYRQVSILGGIVAVAADDDGVHSEGVLRIADGGVTVSRSYEGLESAVMLISGGTIDVTSSDDGINVAGGPGVTSGGEAGMGGPGGMEGGGIEGGVPARPGETSTAADGAATSASVTAASVTATHISLDAASAAMVTPGGGMESGADSGRYLDITGGTIVVNADGDGIDVGGGFTMSDGVVVVAGPTNNGNGALDVDGDFTVTGGTLLAAGSSGMAVAPQSEGQGTLNATFSSNVAAGTRLTVLDTDGSVLASYVAPKVYSSFVLTTGSVESGTSYALVVDGTVAGGSDVGPAIFGGTVTDSSELGSLEAS